MPRIDGTLGESGSPEISITIRGTTGSGIEAAAIIDTGFTGFIAMPLLAAFPLGLTLTGTTLVEMADGSTGTKLTARGVVEVEGRSEEGYFLLEPAESDILVGMEFLRALGYILIVAPSRNEVALIDESSWNSIPRR